MESDGAFTIEMPSSTDAAALAQVHVASWRETYPGLLPDAVIAERTFERRFKLWMGIVASEAAGRCRLARAADGAVVGLVYVSPAFSVGTFADWELSAFYILKACHGRGIGRALLAAGIDIARQAGARQLGFWVVRGNLRAERFYRASGAEKVAERDETDHVDDGYRLTL